MVLANSCLVYLDDVVVLGADFPSHLVNLAAVLQRFREAGLKLKPRKCELLRKHVRFLGHIVSSDGVTVDTLKTEQIQKWPIPTTQHQVQQFLGLASYYQCFVKNFATICGPLHKLTKRNREFIVDIRM